MDPENKPTREELKDEVLNVAKGLAGLGGFNLVSNSEHDYSAGGVEQGRCLCVNNCMSWYCM